MSRLATITDSLAELAELIEAASYALDHLDVLPDAWRRLMRATETALPLVRRWSTRLRTTQKRRCSRGRGTTMAVREARNERRSQALPGRVVALADP